jgi:hypothetical protein
MGFQFGGSFGLGNGLNKFSAMGRNEMAGCGCQGPKPPEYSYVEFSTTFIAFGWIIYPDCIEVRETDLQIFRERKNPKCYMTD